MKWKGRPQSTNIVDKRNDTSGFDKWVGKSLTYNNYDSKRPKPNMATRKTGNDSTPRRSEKNKKRNRQK